MPAIFGLLDAAVDSYRRDGAMRRCAAGAVRVDRIEDIKGLRAEAEMHLQMALRGAAAAIVRDQGD